MSGAGMIITLDKPIEHAGGEIRELKLREPTASEMREAEKLLGEFTAETVSAFQARLLHLVAGLEPAASNLLLVSTMRRAAAYFVGFDKRPVIEPGADANDTLDIDLPEPIESGGVTYVTLELTEPTVGTRRKAETALRSGRTAVNLRHYDIILVAGASNLPFDVAEKLPVSIMNQAAAYLRRFVEVEPQAAQA